MSRVTGSEASPVFFGTPLTSYFLLIKSMKLRNLATTLRLAANPIFSLKGSSMQVQKSYIAQTCTLVFVTLFKVLYCDIVSGVIIELIKFEDWMPHGEFFFQSEEMTLL